MSKQTILWGILYVVGFHLQPRPITFTFTDGVTTTTVPPGSYILNYVVIGGGGAGGSRTNNSSSGGGGGGRGSLLIGSEFFMGDSLPSRIRRNCGFKCRC